MGAWGEGPFDNDGAGDFLSEAADGSPARVVTRALKTVAAHPSGDYLDVDDGQRAWAAAELVALAFGRGDARAQGDAVLDLLGRLKPKEAQRATALAALVRLRERESSELAQLWHEDAAAGERFDAGLDELRARLEAAADGALPLPKPKRKDVIVIEAGDAPGLIATHVITMREVAVFEGAFVDQAAALAAVGAKDAPAARISASVGALFREGRVIANTTVRKDLRGKKLYATESGFLSEDYVLTTPSISVWQPIAYEDALAYDRLHEHGVDEVRRVARGEDVAGRLRTLAERVAAFRTESRSRIEARRAESGPGPFDDSYVLEMLVNQLETMDVAAVVQAEHRRAVASGAQDRAWRRGMNSVLEHSERMAYAFAGIVALWRGWTDESWPAALAGRRPEAPAEETLALAVEAARLRVDQALTPDCALHMIWNDAERDGRTIHDVLASLRAAL